MKKLLLLAAVVLVTLTGSASASIIGHLSVGICSNGGVTVTATSIDWTLPVDASNGCTAAGTGTTIGGTSTISPGDLGTILDLVVGGGSVPGFMVFGPVQLHPGRAWTGRGKHGLLRYPESGQPGLLALAGSPFLLAPNGTGTTVTLVAFGTVTDGTTPTSTWSGAFTTQINRATPASVQTTIEGGGSVSSTYSGEFDVTAIPEPVSMALIGGG